MWNLSTKAEVHYSHSMELLCLPLELLQLTIVHVNALEMWVSVGAVCKAFYSISRDPHTWKAIFSHQMPDHGQHPILLYKSRDFVKMLLKLLNARKFTEALLREFSSAFGTN
jgi:hypothetical protein